MYLSCLLIDVGDNPDRPRPARHWLRNLYHVHQRLCMAFPSDRRKANDLHFLSPYKPEDFGEKQVHVDRAEDSGFLFRIDPQPGGRVVILVQSAVKPDWDYAFGLKDGLLDEQGRPIGNAGVSSGGSAPGETLRPLLQGWGASPLPASGESDEAPFEALVRSRRAAYQELGQQRRQGDARPGFELLCRRRPLRA